MFDALSNRLQDVFRSIRGEGRAVVEEVEEVGEEDPVEGPAEGQRQGVPAHDGDPRAPLLRLIGVFSFSRENCTRVGRARA